jgi:two-component system, NarL family, response regulator EvgA
VALTGAPLLRAQSTVLAVDDDPLSLRIIRSWLRKAGFARVLTCDDPTVVADLIETERPELLLLDLAMPGLDGFSLLEALAPVLAAEPPLRVVVVTGHDHPAIVARAFDLGVRGILSKAATYDELVAALDGALAG